MSTNRTSAQPTVDDKTFKKTEQVVGRPPVTDHDINDEYMRNPPQNVPSGQEREANPGRKEGAYEVEDAENVGDRSAERAGTGRMKPIEMEDVENVTVHSNTVYES